MKRLIALALTCLLAACGTQQRPDDEPDFSPEPYTPDEKPEPRLGEIESLISQAKLEIKRRDFDEARVKLHQVFRRDRWNPEANTLYQDLRIQLKQGDALYQEYLDLYEANKTRGDALWFHLRPLLIARGIKAAAPERRMELTEEQRQRILEIKVALGEGVGGIGSPPKELSKEERLALLEELLRLEPFNSPALQRKLELQPKETTAYYKLASDENPQSGDALSLYGMAIFVSEVGPAGEMKSLDVMRAGWILELPGANLPAVIAEVAYKKIAYDLEPAGIPRVAVLFDKRYGAMNVALNFYRIAALSDPGRDFSEDIKRVQDLAERHKFELEDLAQRK